MEVLFNTFYFVILAGLKEIVCLSEDVLPFYIGFPPSKAGLGGGGRGASLYKTLSHLYFSRLSFLFLTTNTCCLTASFFFSSV